MATSDVTVQDGLKHPYLLALVRWCVSSFWTTATVILHRLITARIPQVKAAKQPKPRPASYGHLHPEPRVDCEVLHSPELPEEHTLDVIFVHGLYGSLGNTWRQGEWQLKYDKAPKKIPLRRPHSVPTCKCIDERTKCSSDIRSDDNTEIGHRRSNENYEFSAKNDKNDVLSEMNDENVSTSQIKRCNCGKDAELNDNNATHNELNAIKCCDIEINDKIRQKNLKGDTDIRKNDCRFKINENDHEFFDLRLPSSNIKKSKSDANIKDYDNYSGEGIMQADVESNLYDNIQKILPNENLLITEKFYNNTLLDDVDIGSYETQAQFVKDLFENSVKVKSDECESDVKASDCKCEMKCEAGCGCICDDCYSPCWPRDWIRVDYPGARVISINYTSDPYLWRPLWIKESKRLRLHERAEQMMSQLLQLGVGERPIIWVGHSKGGLFIKKIYCEAYEAHLKLTKQNAAKERPREEINEQYTTECNNDNEINHCRDKMTDTVDANIADLNSNENNYGENKIDFDRDYQTEKVNKQTYSYMNINICDDIIDQINRIAECNDDVNSNESNNLSDFSEIVDSDMENEEDILNSSSYDKSSNDNINKIDSKDVFDDSEMVAENCDNNGNIPNSITDDEENKESHLNTTEAAALEHRARLWRKSAGFMFYSVPHRGSPLADIKTPITARSVELMEICKDCPLVLSLQDSWSVATAPTMPPVRSVVETCRTLMSVLYLRIVSVDSADPGIGSLNGVDVDHREICKPSSRSCLLYQELMTLMEAALNKHDTSSAK